MANRLIDSYTKSDVVDIKKCNMDIYFHGLNKNVIYKDDFEKAYKEYLIDLGVKNTEDFNVVNFVFPYMTHNIVYDAESKKIFSLRKLKKVITINDLKTFLDECDLRDSEDISQIFYIENYLSDEDYIEINLDFARQQMEYNRHPSWVLERLLSYYDFDESKFNTEYLYKFTYDLDLSHSHIGVGIKFRPISADYLGDVVLELGSAPVQRMVDDNGFDFIYYYADVVKYNDRY